MKDNNLKFLIGTLYSVENEFDECIISIKNQNYKNFEHVVFSGMENREAHNTLYNHFMQNSQYFDVFVKVDADMIIEDVYFLDKLNSYLNKNLEISRLIIPVFDYYTDSDIAGVNVYRNDVKWDTNINERYFVDRIEISATIKKIKTELFTFKNSITHCKNPNIHQTYMFGYHRTLKAFQPEIFLPKLESSNWKRFHYIYKHKLNIPAYHQVFYGIYDAITFSESTKFNSYKYQLNKTSVERHFFSFLRLLFSSFHPNLSYVTVYILVRLKFIMDFLIKKLQFLTFQNEAGGD